MGGVVWLQGDSAKISQTEALDNAEFDFVFSCPPYGDLEVYSDDAADISNMQWADFARIYKAIIKQAVAKLKNNRFAAFVVGEIRNAEPKSGGVYRNFVGLTIEAFEEAGAAYYNEFIYRTSVGSLAIRVGRQFNKSRKTGKTHQNLLVFYKGDPREISEVFGEVVPNEEEESEAGENLQKEDGLVNNEYHFTPVQQRGEYWFKRDDLFDFGGVRGGKVRTCLLLCRRAQQKGKAGVTTAGSRQSPQINIVANVAAVLGLKSIAHTPKGDLGKELELAKQKGIDIHQHKAGYNNVIIKRSKDYADENNYEDIPFGMECPEAVKLTSLQVKNIPFGEIKRIIIPVGSGMSLAGVLWGLKDNDFNIPVIGVVVGAEPIERLNKYAPKNWSDMVTLVKSNLDYHQSAEITNFCGIDLDPIYESKVIPYVEKGDLFWVVGVRQSVIL